MKIFRYLIIPAASFVIAWLVADFASDRSAKGVEPDAASVLPSGERLSARPGLSGRQRVEQLHRDFHDQPISEWNRLWDGFARETDFETLKKLAEFPPTGDDGYVVAERNVLQVLSREELAVRSGRVEVPAPEAFAALAEVDAAAAWRDLERHYQSDHAMAAFRSLALRDPVGTYERFQTMPPAPGVQSQYIDDLLGKNRSGIDHTPVGAIFGAWARKDPQAAAEVATKLPLRVRREAVGKLAISWAYQDGPAALRFLVDSGAIYQSSAFGEIRMDVILRASFRNHPAVTARIVTEHRVLREYAGDMRVVKPWYEADPDSVIAWILEGERMPEEDSTNQTEYNRGRASILYSKLRGNDQADLIRRLAAAGSISSVASEDPGKVTDVEVEDAPAVLCDRWLEALRLDGDPDRSLAAIGLGEYQG